MKTTLFEPTIYAHSELTGEQLDRILSSIEYAIDREEPRWYLAGCAVANYYHRKRYKENDAYDTFGKFCEETLGLSQTRIFKLIASAQQRKLLKDIAEEAGDGYVPHNEMEANLLRRLSKTDIETLASTLKGDGPASMAVLKATIKEVKADAVASCLDIEMITASDMPYFDSYHAASEEKDLLSHKKKVPYARQRMIAEGITHRQLGGHVLVLESADGKIAFYWPRLTRWKWMGEESMTGGADPEGVIHAMGYDR